MTLTQAVHIVASQAITELVDRDLADAWGDIFPEIGEHDWTRVEKRVEQRLTRVSPEKFAEAYALLSGRASGETA